MCTEEKPVLAVPFTMLHKQRIPLDTQVWEYSEIQSKFQLNTLCPWVNNLGEEREMEGAQTARRTHPFCLSQNILWTQKKDSGILRYTDHQGTVDHHLLSYLWVRWLLTLKEGKEKTEQLLVPYPFSASLIISIQKQKYSIECMHIRKWLKQQLSLV